MKKLIVPFILGLISFGSLTFFLLTNRGQYLNSLLVSRYALIGLIVFAYGSIMNIKDLRGAVNILGLGVVLSTLVLFLMPKQAEVFSDLDAIIMWLMIMVGSLVIGVVYELIRFFYLKSKQSV